MSLFRLVARVSENVARISYETPRSVSTWYVGMLTSEWPCARCGGEIKRHTHAFCPPPSKRKLRPFRFHLGCVDKLGPTKITYYLRGTVERCVGPRRGFVHLPGYSTQGPTGARYPWMTRAECIRDAKAQGATARFEKQAPPW